MLRLHTLIFVLGLMLLSSWTAAQETTAGDPATIPLLVQQIRELQRQTGELQDKVKALEAEKAPAPTATSESPIPTRSEPESSAQSISSVLESLHDLRGIQWRGFGEVNYKVLDQRQPELGTNGFVPGSAGNFYTGDFDLFLSAKINDKASVLSEIAFGEGDHQTFNVDLERFLLQYAFNDHLKISFGRYQTGIGYYNREFRSTTWLQTTADRPLIMEFAVDGGLLPTQAVGVSITGRVPSGRLGLNYLFEYGSSDTVRPAIDGSGALDDENNGNDVNLGFFLRPEILPGLQLGGSFYHDKISDSRVQSFPRIGQSILNAHVVYVARGFEILNEGFLIRHARANSQTISNMPAFYSQLSRRFGRIRPFFRYQYVNTNNGDTIFHDVGLRYGPSFGARYDIEDNIAFKVQLDHTVRGGKPDLNGLQTQLAFTF
jgi:hypothetical protein